MAKSQVQGVLRRMSRSIFDEETEQQLIEAISGSKNLEVLRENSVEEHDAEKQNELGDEQKDDEFMITPLWLAVITDQFNIVEQLLGYNAPVDQHRYQGMTELQYAASMGYDLIIERLLKFNADLTLTVAGTNDNAFDLAENNNHHGAKELIRRKIENIASRACFIS